MRLGYPVGGGSGRSLRLCFMGIGRMVMRVGRKKGGKSGKGKEGGEGAEEAWESCHCYFGAAVKVGMSRGR